MATTDKPPATIVFDGECRLCERWVRFVMRRDPDGVFRFAPMQTDAGAHLLHRHGLDPGDVRTMLLVTGGRAYLRSEAALRIAGRLSGPWKALAALRIVPRFLRDPVYDWVARNRFRWFGRRDQCLVPTPEERDRFLE